jgi:cytochrome P450
VITDQEAMTIDEARRRIVEMETYTDDQLVLEVCSTLREKAPIVFVAHPEYPPVWVLTRHADIQEMQAHPENWAQGRDTFLFSTKEVQQIADRSQTANRNLNNMDGEEHHDVRALTASWFTPRNLAKVHDLLAQYAKDAVDQMEDAGGFCDFAEIACRFPLRMILSMVGVPEEDHEYLLELSGGRLGTPDVRTEQGLKYKLERGEGFRGYFLRSMAERRENPKDDLLTVLATAPEPAAQWLGESELLGYNTVFATAGHDSTTASIVGGVHAFAQFPDELERMRKDPRLGLSAANEIIRWVTPVKSVTRTAIQRVKLGGTQFEVGDRVLMSLASANRDPEAFENPLTFDIGRSPNPHQSFGFGKHHCLGAPLARIEIKAFFDELVPRLRSVEIAGETPLRATATIGGFLSLPVRYTWN